MSYVLLSIIAGTSIGLSDYFSKLAGKNFSSLTIVLTSSLFVLGFALAVAGGQIQLPIAGSFWSFTALVVSLEIMAFWFFILGLKNTELSLATISLGLQPVFGAVLSLLIVGEKLSLAGSLGILIVLAGCVLSNYKQNLNFKTLAVWPLTALVAAMFLWPLTYTLDKYSLGEVAPEQWLIAKGIIKTLVIGVLFIFTKPNLKIFWSNKTWHLIAIGLLSRIFLVGLTNALKTGPVGYVLALTQIQVLVGVFLGLAVLKESGFWQKSAACGLVILGAGLIYLFP
jgi:drug/metabolite transporter (DMT)-like permease